ncbi:hypothetical protein ARMGADRAFT_1088283 [Armillaria gallica]|uniref:DEAD/DEAH box helicase domain-containing protein n=1 Tax=Armillaria gallica TaxID=47427 RepID=A0A2H3D617_ARMGA|nr:hypothetical protein ARMGADRAFT_1088283 [Armillaria gallica]
MSKCVQLHDWTKGKPDIVVATPGRIGDIINSKPNIAKALKITHTLVLELDDNMLLDIGFHNANSRDLLLTPEREALFFLCYSPAIRRVACEALAKDYKYINYVDDLASPSTLPQF